MILDKIRKNKGRKEIVLEKKYLMKMYLNYK